ncbi:MAG: glucosaminidase domain-containing protein [Ferruginibacter sp.]
MFKISITILLSFFSVTALAQRLTIEEYVEQFKETAMNEMRRSGVPAAITLAQGILESENGNSELVKKSNNHFGIKCKSNWTGESVTHDDDANGECFRAYTNASDSYRDHSDFLKNNQRYASLFKLDPTDYAGWAKGLKKAGYATNPRYPELLIKYIEQNNLQQYSLLVLNKLPETEVAAQISSGTENKTQPVLSESRPLPSAQVATLSPDAGKVISINNTKCVFVKKGTSLLAIADKNNISLSKLMEFNDMTEDGLLGKDQYIYLARKSKTGDQEFYIVQPGETLNDVAQLTGIQLKHLLEYNNVKADATVTAGTKLFLQPGLQNDIRKADVSKSKVHIVGAKEGLYSIARTYNVTVQQLREWNKLESDNLKIGQQIIVSK